MRCYPVRTIRRWSEVVGRRPVDYSEARRVSRVKGRVPEPIRPLGGDVLVLIDETEEGRDQLGVTPTVPSEPPIDPE